MFTRSVVRFAAQIRPWCPILQLPVVHQRRFVFSRRQIAQQHSVVHDSVASPSDQDSKDAMNEAFLQDLDGIDAMSLVKRIVEHHRVTNNRTFLLPLADEEAMTQVVKSFEVLLSEGVTPQFLFDACVKREEIFRALTKNGEQLLKTIAIIMGCTGLTYENTMRTIFHWLDELVKLKPRDVEARLSVFLGRGIMSGAPMARLIRRCPLILFASDPERMDVALETMSHFFPQDDMQAIIKSSPQVALQDPEQLELRYEYIYYHMACEPEEFIDCIRWHELDLDEIIARHEFLKRCGKYYLPDPKRPQLKMNNPPMFKIFDTEDADFATQVAGVRCEEWTLFKQIHEMEEAQSTMERPYEVIKPSMRKAYQRRMEAEKARRKQEEMADLMESA